MSKSTMPSDSIQRACVQISVERLNQSKYMDTACYFSKYNLEGFKGIIDLQEIGEMEHQRLIIEFLGDRNAEYYVETLPYAHREFETVGEILEFWLATEQETTRELESCREAASSINDTLTENFWRMMLDKQIEEEKEAMYFVERAGMLGIDTLNLGAFNLSDSTEYVKRQALIMLDKEAREIAEAAK